jgi:hypothetical protein
MRRNQGPVESWGRRTFSAVERLEAVLDQVPAHRAVLRAVLLGLCREEVVLVLVHNAVLQSYMWVMHGHVSDHCEPSVLRAPTGKHTQYNRSGANVHRVDQLNS